MYEFEWDPAKAASNRRKHNVGFELAATVFLDRFARSVLDEDHSEFEEQWITVGHANDGRVLVVCHTWARTNVVALVRIISAHPATRNERRQYQSGR